MYHHEWFDGRGYPKGLKGNQIPISARIFAVADVYDALVSKRSYKEALPHDSAVEIIKSETGQHFDPEIIKVFLKIQDKFLMIKDQYSSDNMQKCIEYDGGI
ncbi:Cyclic di-GMP phosphodiesterase [bioreactor metagenome]|uniref:Cyclic di-GMP phosphodiesterase n=2 Tax=root TaxID=1 RepID=A0A645FEV8_9ZZZZ